MKKIATIVILLLVLLAGTSIYWLSKDNQASLVEEGKEYLSPTQVESIKNIGKWEFLSVSDEEIIDTLRHGFFGDDQLMRIYYGRLSLGIDMKEAKDGWIQAEKDTITCTLPAIQLLDHNFIDEAKTKSFYESGQWTGTDRQAMYDRAYAKMKRRCLNAVNIIAAKDNAKAQFRQMLKAMGYTNIKVEFEKK